MKEKNAQMLFRNNRKEEVSHPMNQTRSKHLYEDGSLQDVSCSFSLHQQMLSPLFLCQTAPPKDFFYQTEIAGSTDSESFLDQNTCCL
ncbi:unnamed protein product [Musa hybrid cultivar]